MGQGPFPLSAIRLPARHSEPSGLQYPLIRSEGSGWEDMYPLGEREGLTYYLLCVKEDEQTACVGEGPSVEV